MASGSSTNGGVALNSGVGSIVLAWAMTAGSKATLITGSVCGSHLLAAAWLLSKKRTKLGSLIGGRFSSMVTCSMFKRFLQFGGFIPGFIAAISAVATLYNVVSFFESKKNEESIASAAASGAITSRVTASA